MFNWRDLFRGFVNLPHRQDRLLHMEQELERVGLSGTARIDGLNTKGEEWNKYPYQKMFQRTSGAIGCMLSQMRIMELAYEFGKGAMVLEDDIVFADDIIDRLDYIENFVNEKEPDVDVIFLGGTVHTDKAWWHSQPHEEMLAPYCDCTLNKDYEAIDDEHMVRVYGMFSTHAYIVPFDKIPKILSLLKETLPITIGIDFSFIIHEPKLKCFAFLPGSVKQIDNRSDIGFGDTIFSGFSALGSHWFQSKL